MKQTIKFMIYSNKIQVRILITYKILMTLFRFLNRNHNLVHKNKINNNNNNNKYYKIKKNFMNNQIWGIIYHRKSKLINKI